MYINILKNNIPYRILVSDIKYVKVLGENIVIKTNNKIYKVKGDSTNLIKKLKKYGFVDSSENCIINLNYVKYIKNLYIYFNDGEIILLTYDKYKEIIKRITIKD